MGKRGNLLWQALKGKRGILTEPEPPPPVYWKEGQYYHAVCGNPLIKTDQRWKDKAVLYCVWCCKSITVRFPMRR